MAGGRSHISAARWLFELSSDREQALAESEEIQRRLEAERTERRGVLETPPATAGMPVHAATSSERPRDRSGVSRFDPRKAAVDRPITLFRILGAAIGWFLIAWLTMTTPLADVLMPLGAIGCILADHHLVLRRLLWVVLLSALVTALISEIFSSPFVLVLWPFVGALFGAIAFFVFWTIGDDPSREWSR